MDEAHKAKRAKTRKETTKRHKRMACKSFELKVDRSHLSKKTIADIDCMFREGRWLYNYLIGMPAKERNTYAKSKSKKVMVKTSLKKEVPVVFEERELTIIPAQMRQEIYHMIGKSLKTLSALKKKGKKVGRLRYKSCKSLPLNQYEVSYQFYTNYVRLQGIKQRLRVRGLSQIPKNAEITKGTLMRRHGDYYIRVTCFVGPKPEAQPVAEPDLGLDFGIRSQITFSNGVKLAFKVPESKRTRLLHRKLSRSKVGSKNRMALRSMLQKSYEKDNNRKADIKRKIVSYLNRNYHVAVQDDNIRGWQRMWGKSINNSAIGSILSELKTSSRAVVVDRYFPSTKQCRIRTCKHIAFIGLDDRVFRCESCGHIEDRDVHSARNILVESSKKINDDLVPTGCREFKPDEKRTTAMAYYFKTVSKFLSVIREAQVL